jgi:hypothetical protein
MCPVINSAPLKSAIREQCQLSRLLADGWCVITPVSYAGKRRATRRSATSKIEYGTGTIAIANSVTFELAMRRLGASLSPLDYVPVFTEDV